MLKSLVRTFRGPSRDPRMTYISRPMPRDLPDEQVVEALEIALAENPNPAVLVETLPSALKRVTGRDLQVMIRDGDVGLWPGLAATAYPLLVPSEKAEQTRAAIIAADTPDAETPPQGPKPGWAPPAPPERHR